MRLAFDNSLIRTNHFDGEMSMLADRHYSRRTVGARQFLYSGRKLVLRNADGTVLFGWIWPDNDKRMDGQTGYNCAIFRNESSRKAHEIILEAEQLAFAKWGPNRMYSYIDPAKTAVITALRNYRKWGIRKGERIVGFCYRKAGWKPRLRKNGQPHVSQAGQWLFVKSWRGWGSATMSMVDIFTEAFTEKLIEDSRLCIAERRSIDRKLWGFLSLLGQAKAEKREVPDALLDELHRIVYGRKRRLAAAGGNRQEPQK